MAFDSDIHHRRSIRLRDYEYSSSGAYFVTICAFQRECLFGEMADGEIRLNEVGHLVDDSWRQILDHFSGVDIDRYVIMPNHFHGIVTTVGAGFPRPDSRNVAHQGGETPPQRQATLGQIVGYFKYQSTKTINQTRDNPGLPVWQRNYYERVIRNERELAAIRQYIVDNPGKWAEDENHPARVGSVITSNP
jgi:REP element-mobilizing transposase RayT